MSNSFEIFACMLHADLDTKKFNKFSNPNFCAACQSCMQCAQKLMRGYQTLTLCHFFYEKEKVRNSSFLPNRSRDIGGKFFDFFVRNWRSCWCWYLVTMHGKSDFFSLSGRYMPTLLKIVFTFKFHP